MRRSQQVIAAIVLAACVLMVLHHLLSESGPSAPSNRPPSAADLLYYQDMPLRHHSAAAVLDAEDRRTVEAFQKLVVGAEQRKKLTHGSVIMGKMGNDTIRAELGRATWRLLHTMASRFPPDPSPLEQMSFETFILLLSRLYPCGNCASEFQKILVSNPPALTSRDSAVEWACRVHNIVNRRLNKKEFDCSKALEAWQCGCADEVLAGKEI